MANTYQSTRWTGIQLNNIYPIGSIYLSVNSTDPGTLFGGTWEQIENTFLIAAGSSYTAGSTGGAATHSHTTNNHTLTTSEIPAHTHGSKSLSGTFQTRPMANASSSMYQSFSGIVSQANADSFNSGAVSFTSQNQNYWRKITINATHEHTSVGGNAGHNHGNTSSESSLPPYLAVYMWKRIA